MVDSPRAVTRHAKKAGYALAIGLMQRAKALLSVASKTKTCPRPILIGRQSFRRAASKSRVSLAMRTKLECGAEQAGRSSRFLTREERCFEVVSGKAVSSNEALEETLDSSLVGRRNARGRHAEQVEAASRSRYLDPNWTQVQFPVRKFVEVAN